MAAMTHGGILFRGDRVELVAGASTRRWRNFTQYGDSGKMPHDSKNAAPCTNGHLLPDPATACARVRVNNREALRVKQYSTVCVCKVYTCTCRQTIMRTRG